MQSVQGLIQLSAADLVGHLNCRHLTNLDAAVATGQIKAPKVWDPLLKILWERGLAHEQKYVEHLHEAGFEVVRIDGSDSDGTQIGDTIDAMRAGAQIIVQGTLIDGRWTGRADILM